MISIIDDLLEEIEDQMSIMEMNINELKNKKNDT
jgi:hypothetical protein